MGFLDKFVKEVKRVDPAVLGFVLGGPIGALGAESFMRIREPVREARRERKAMEREAAELQEMRRGQMKETQYRQARQQRLLMAEQARARRVSMAEGLVGESMGIVNSTPVDGPNMEVNKIPVLDSVDDMGNSIPEV